MATDSQNAQSAPAGIEKKLYAVIMAGGAGTRFWPASTQKKPKQFLKLLGERSLFQQSLDRLLTFVPAERILVLTAASFVDLCREQAPQLPAENVIGEPMRRDTAAAIALAAVIGEARFGQDSVMMVLTSDHRISPDVEFQKTLLSAAQGAEATGALYTLGIEPTFAATGFGYLEQGKPCGTYEECQHFALKRFVEKPQKDVAEGYLNQGGFLWNSGMFVWTTAAILAAFEAHLPAHLEALRPVAQKLGTDGFEAALARAFEGLEKISVDFGIMEKAEKVHCLPATFTWSDLGSFPALEEHLPADEGGNIARGQMFHHESAGNIIFCDGGDEVVALLGVDNLVVVRAGKTTLVADKSRAEELKKLVAKLPEHLL